MAAARAPTGRDVAVRARVSQSTVSLVMTGRAAGRVAPSTREAVLRAADELGYRPHAGARSLRRGRTGLVLVVLPDVRNPFHARLLAGVQTRAAAAGYAVVLAADDARSLLARMPTAVDGVLVCGRSAEAGDPRLPTVVVGGSAGPGGVEVGFAVEEALAVAVQHVRALGHRRIGHLRSPGGGMTSTAEPDRAAPERGEPERGEPGRGVAEAVVPVCVPDAERAAPGLLVGASACTAVVCDDDLLAAGVYRAAHRLGLRVPDDVSVVALGGSPAAALLYPDLTVLQMDGARLGHAAMDLLLAALAGTGTAARSQLTAPLVVRGSTAPPGVRRS